MPWSPRRHPYIPIQPTGTLSDEDTLEPGPIPPMGRLQSPATDVKGVRSATVAAPVLDPRVVLKRAGDGIRGFWSRGERWVIHWGAAGEIRIPWGEDGPARFSEVREWAADVFADVEEIAGREEGVARPPRFYGGFSFRSRSEPRDPCWDPFGGASFVLPGVEVAGRSDSARVTVRSVGAAETDEELVARARHLAESLASGGGAEGSDSTASASTGGPDALDRAWESERSPGATPAGLRREEGDVEEWSGAVEEALAWIEKGRLSKVVLARTLDLLGDALPDPASVALDLREQNPGTHVFLFEPTPGSALVGAAPETVATVLDGSFRATAVAGSISRGTTPAEQEALAYKLLESEKDRVEHAIAVQDMVERLRPRVRDLTWDSEPHVLTLSRIQHLETRIQARLDSGESVLSILDALHPTPAVCGLPRDAALDFLRMEEPFDRGWYCGPVGWFNSTGEGVFAPALRCAVLDRERWRLYAGAGIVSGSDPALEWEETRIKFEPVLRALDGSRD